MKKENEDFAWHVVASYTRAQALEDGTLIDVTDLAKEAGFTIPVAITRSAYESYVKVPPDVTLQDETGRLWDILTVLAFQIRTDPNPGSERLHFELYVRNSDSKAAQRVTLKSVCGPGDRAEPVLTILCPGED